MTSSLPKIKTVSVENSQAGGTQRKLKFKKLKLSTDQNSNIQRFKSLKTQRLSSLQRYSTVQQQRQYKNEKIHMNLLQRKLLTGTYDQTTQTGHDLNVLKQKTDNFKNLSKARKIDIVKLKQNLHDIKKQIDIYTNEKKVRQQKIQDAKEKCQKQKAKTQIYLSERYCLDHMILTRKSINLYLTNKLNESKAYFSKLQSLEHQMGYELREYHEKSKNLQTKIKKINQQMSREQRTRQQSIYQKTTDIQRRTNGQLQREKKSKQYVEFLNKIDREQQEKSFNDLYFGIICHKFIQKYGNQTHNNLQEKYQTLENKYNKMASYKKFNHQKPLQMITRFDNQKVQEQQFRQKIKIYQKRVQQLQKRRINKENDLYKLNLTTTKINQEKYVQVQKDEDEKQNQVFKHQRQVHKFKEQSNKLDKIIQEVGKWGQRYGRELQISVKKSNNCQDISRNILNVIKVVVKETQLVQEMMKKQALAEENRKKKLEQESKRIQQQAQESKKKQQEAQKNGQKEQDKND